MGATLTSGVTVATTGVTVATTGVTVATTGVTVATTEVTVETTGVMEMATLTSEVTVVTMAVMAMAIPTSETTDGDKPKLFNFPICPFVFKSPEFTLKTSLWKNLSVYMNSFHKEVYQKILPGLLFLEL